MNLDSQPQLDMALIGSPLTVAAHVLLIACYELGHQPLGLAWPLAVLRQAGIEAAALDLAVQPLDEHAARAASLVGIAVPMPTALKLGVQAGQRVRAGNPGAHICFFGLYPWLNRDYLLRHCADSVIGGEVEAPLLQLARAVLAGDAAQAGNPRPHSGLGQSCGGPGRAGGNACACAPAPDCAAPDRRLVLLSRANTRLG
jgi:hypothetical protein